ncbi:MAG TPA: hypothetical protein DCG49_03855 [Ruminococcus sp.]|nr:hypothetical protein [Ruminococcus sp.]
MKQNRYHLTAIALSALLLCSNGLTACSNTDSAETEPAEQSVAEIISEETEAVSAQTETTTAEASSETETTTTKAENVGQIAAPSAVEYNAEEQDTMVQEAQEVLEQFLQACRNNDEDAVMKLSNIGLALGSFGAVDDTEQSDEQIRSEMMNALSGLTDFRISNGAFEQEIMDRYNQYRTEIFGEIDGMEADAGDDDLKIISMVQNLYQPVDGVCTFEVEATEDGETQTDTMYLLRMNGKWIVDIALIPSLVGYTARAKDVAANTAAKDVKNAANTALVEMDDAGMNVQLLDGAHYFKPEDFADVPAVDTVRTEEDAVNRLKKGMLEYFADVPEYDQVALKIDGGMCIAVAVALKDGEKTQFGSYPLLEDDTEYTDIEAVLRAVDSSQ